MVETVGAGQNEVDIARLAHTTIVVDSPGMGDDIQAIKAGILEIADILVINKADIPGADNTERALRANLDLGYTVRMNHNAAHQVTVNDAVEEERTGWLPPIIKTIATQNTGIEEVVAKITAHREYLKESELWNQRDQERLRAEVFNQLQETLYNQWRQRVTDADVEGVLDKVFERQLSPGAAIETLVNGSYNKK
jgi:LAO/AO transport system kinase